MAKPWQQGHFDGLCGIYALINAVHHLSRGMNEAHCSDLFQFLIEAGGDQFPKAVYAGLDFDPLFTIAEKLQDHLAGSLPLRLSRPFVDQNFESADAYLEALQEKLVCQRTIAVIGLGQPWDHWTVVTDVLPRSVRFADSYGIRRFNKSAFALVDNPSTITIDCGETIVIEALPRPSRGR